MSATTLLHTETRYLPVRLTPGELIDRVDQFSETLRLEKQLAERHEAEKARMKVELKDIEGRKAREAAIIESRHEDRRVEVQHVLDADKPLVREVRQDTGEVLRERAATQAELQRSLPANVEEEAPFDPFAEGADAAAAGHSETSNPYEAGSVAEASWNDGFNSINQEGGHGGAE
jgi:peptidoglycan hydrolase CwlO-like protein